MQWHRPAFAFNAFSECACSWHQGFLFTPEIGTGEETGTGGSPIGTTAGQPLFPFDTLPSPVTDDRSNEEELLLLFPEEMLKSRVKDWVFGLIGVCKVGPRRNRACPVRFKTEIRCLNLVMVELVISE